MLRIDETLHIEKKTAQILRDTLENYRLEAQIWYSSKFTTIEVHKDTTATAGICYKDGNG